MIDEVSIFDSLAPVNEEELAPEALDQRLCGAREPFVIRGLMNEWPLVKVGLEGADAAREYLVSHARDRKFPVSIGKPGGGGRLFYDSAMNMNFQMARGPLESILDGIAANEDKADAPVIYLGSIRMYDYFDGLAEANRPPLGPRKPTESIWIGTDTRIAAHNDIPDNLAVCAVGRRRFTLFPPDQLLNLYPGPIENTPAGRAISMVDFLNPDFGKYPRFREALRHAQVVELDPGDALFIPSLWWHHVEGLSRFNVLVNYWWRDVPAYLGEPEDAMLHAILSIRDLPPHEKKLWRELFCRYVFDNDPELTNHLPPEAQGILAPLTAQGAAQLRAKLLRGLSR